MPPFRFRFDPILLLRCRARDEAGGEVAKVNEAIRRVDEQIAELQTQRDQIRESRGSIHTGSNRQEGVVSISVDGMLQLGRYDLMLQADQMSLRQTRSQLETERDRRQGLLVEAEAEVKRLEKLRETQRAEHQQLQLRAEQAEADDLTAARMLIAARSLNKNRTATR